LASLAIWGGSVGADFVGVNPLHALLNRNGHVSPYSPVSRLFRNPLYVDVDAVPELQRDSELREGLRSAELLAELEALRESPAVRYEQVAAVKGMVLDALHRAFLAKTRGSGDDRDRAYEEFVARGGEALDRFATWMAIAEHEHTPDWRTWPRELQRHDSDA